MTLTQHKQQQGDQESGHQAAPLQGAILGRSSKTEGKPTEEQTTAGRTVLVPHGSKGRRSRQLPASYRVTHRSHTS